LLNQAIPHALPPDAEIETWWDTFTISWRVNEATIATGMEEKL
jgi:hypothetical protein